MNADLNDRAETERWPGVGEDTIDLLVSCVQDYAIFILDPFGHVASWNRGAEMIKGYTAQEIIGRHFSAFYPEEDVRAGKPDRGLAVAAEAGHYEDEGWRVRKDGSLFWASVVITALRDSSGVLRGFGKVTRDLTERRLSEFERLDRERGQTESYREEANRFAEMERIKTEFLNLASHELRGPLAVARGYLSLLFDGSIDLPRFRPYAEIIERELAQIDWLVQKMLETARLEYEQLDLAEVDVELNALVERQIVAIRPILTPRHTLRSHIGQGSPVTVRGDPVRLGTAVLNLLDNAIKYSPNGGTIEVRLAARDGHALVSVRDQGIGIDKEDFPRLFARFTRLRLDETANIAGTGLGLYLVYEIARRHGGDISVTSKRGRGSRFTLKLPLAAPAPKAAPAAKSGPMAVPERGAGRVIAGPAAPQPPALSP